MIDATMLNLRKGIYSSWQRDIVRKSMARIPEEQVSMTLQERDERQTYETVASRIVQLIAETGLKPGDRLPTERELSRELGVSRHTVSQAVKVLAVSGVLRPRQGSGIYVTQTSAPTSSTFVDVTLRGDPQKVQQFSEFRMTLEMQAARLAAERITPRGLRQIEDAALTTQASAEASDPVHFTEADTRLHLGIAEATANDYLFSAVSAVYRVHIWTTAVGMGAEGGIPGSLTLAAEQHLAIVQAIRDGNPEAAAANMQEHIQMALESYQQEVRRRMSADLSPR